MFFQKCIPFKRTFLVSHLLHAQRGKIDLVSYICYSCKYYSYLLHQNHHKKEQNFLFFLRSLNHLKKNNIQLFNDWLQVVELFCGVTDVTDL